MTSYSSCVRAFGGRLLAALVLLASLALPAAAQPVRGDSIDSELVAATDSVVPGKPFQVGLRLKHDPHWHTYWLVPGDSGLPTRIEWKLPPGWSAGELQWPVPMRLPVGPLMNFGYEGEVLLMTELLPPAGLKVGELAFLEARADWLICKDVCIPGGADLKLVAPIKDAAGPSRFAPLFAAMRTQVPQPLSLAQASAAIEANRLQLSFAAAKAPRSIEFFPLDEGRIEPAARQVLQREGDRALLLMSAAQPVAAEFKRIKGVLVVDGGPAKAAQGGYAGVIDVPLVAGTVAMFEGAAALAAAKAAGAAVPVAGATPAQPQTTLWLALVGAFLGGLILNLMPCVFPVLSLKLLSLMQHQKQDAAAGRRASLAPHGGAFAAGVVLSFVALAGALIALRASGAELGWGFQLQTPWVVASLTALFFVIGLNLIGAFEFNVGAGIASSGTAQKLQDDSLAGSFWTGVLAVIVAAPCTAPFMGAALGFAMTQPAAIALTVFAMLGVGMAAPYMLLTLFPKLLARLPRPGVWMERFKQAMAFPMFLTCVWLLWVLAQQVDVNAVALMLAALVTLGAGAWAFGLAQRGARGWRWVAVGSAALALWAIVGASNGNLPESVAATGGSARSERWSAWSPQAVVQAQAAGKAVFVDFTAAWCVTCQANKKLVLNTDSVQAAFAARNVVLLRADWTNRDATITQELAKFNRNGVPLYVLHDARGQTQVLPELLTERTVLDALARL
jgi:thiol:disulfide interchange protein/DsbC/DsbD-like thiol-disulfide interchange protein